MKLSAKRDGSAQHALAACSRGSRSHTICCRSLGAVGAVHLRSGGSGAGGLSRRPLGRLGQNFTPTTLAVGQLTFGRHGRRPRRVHVRCRRRRLRPRRVVLDLLYDQPADGRDAQLGLLEVDRRDVHRLRGELHARPPLHPVEEGVGERVIEGAAARGIEAEDAVEQRNRRRRRRRAELLERLPRHWRERGHVLAHLLEVDPAERPGGRADHREDDVELIEVGRGA
mmetsp:Transcript_7085/g.16573  ORF Transcript_7085/g.16573 Transcript_7085/m.16573 type:complete len:226 (-) Transcript_7085:1010-1687(-)